MLPLAVAVVIALLIPAVTRGSYARLVETKWAWGPLLVVGMVVQVLLETSIISRDHWNDVGYGLLVGSYVLIIAFCARNLVHRGMSIVLIGILCNTVTIVVNHGMPVDAPPDWLRDGSVKDSIKHHVQRDSDDLMFLSDIIVLRDPWNAVMSFGDLILAVGLCDVTFHASRRGRSRRGRGNDEGAPGAAVESGEADAPPPVDAAGNGVGIEKGGSADELAGLHDVVERVEHSDVVHVAGR